MKQLRIYINYLVLFNLLTIAAAFLLQAFIKPEFPAASYALLSLSFSLICILMVRIFLRGQTRDPQSQTLHSLVAVTLKFLSDMVLALIWFNVAKKTSLTSLIIFFVLYLALTIFSVIYILKILKSKPL